MQPGSTDSFPTPERHFLNHHCTMSNLLCLGQFIIPLYRPTPISLPEFHQPAFLQRGTRRVHVWCSPRLLFGDLDQLGSDYIGPLLGQIGDCSSPISEEGIPTNDPTIMKLRAFVVTKNSQSPQLRGCVFSLSRNEQLIVQAFRNAQISLTPIWNYNPNIFFNIPQTTRPPPINNQIEEQASFRSSQARCLTTLKHHQIQALQFLTNNESLNGNNLDNLWNRRENNWIRETCDPLNLQPPEVDVAPCLGSILADDMGLGKTLTTLMLISMTSHSAREFQQSDISNHPTQCGATLVICPLGTLSNWENEINMHFGPQSIPYVIFHGRDRQHVTREQFDSSLVVLTTYEMIGASGNPLHSNQITIESLQITWYRIVLDEAQ